MIHLAILVFLLFIIWIFIPWNNLYFIEKALVDKVSYKLERNVFKKPLKKILRTKRWGNNPWDVFVLTKVNLLLKYRYYILTEPTENDMKLMGQFKQE